GVVHVVLQVVERERALRIECGEVVQLVVPDVGAEFDRVSLACPCERIRELVRVRDAGLWEVARAADREQPADGGAGALWIVLGEIKVPPYQREAEFVEAL